jgi:tetratricopeptide (TPR) repeat protein
VQPDLVLSGRCEELRLEFLSEHDVARYFTQRFAGHRFPPELPAVVRARTRGNPLFLDRVVDSWVAERLLQPGAEGWALRVPLAELADDTPPSIVSMIERELDRLGPFERHLLEAASAAGVEFTTAAVAAALGADLVRVEEKCLEWARRRQFFELDGSGEWPDGTVVTRCSFIHAVYQQVTYARIGLAGRAQLHLRIGGRQEAAYGARARDIAPELAMHFERGHDVGKAITYLAASGEQALRRSACQEAVAHYERALGLVGRLPEGHERDRSELSLAVALGTPLAMTRGHAAAEVEAVYSRARQLCDGQQVSQQHFQAVMGVGAFYLVRGEYRTAHALGEQYLTLARAAQDRGLGLQMSLLSGLASIFLGEPLAALRELGATIADYDPSRHGSHIFLYMQDPCVCAHAMRTLPAWILGRSSEALEHGRIALERARQLAQPAAVVLGLLSLAQIEIFEADFDAAAERVEEGLALASEHGFDLYLHTLGMLRGEVLLGRGRVAAGCAALEAGWRTLCSTGSELAGARWRSALALALAHTGRFAEAFEQLAAAFERVASHGERWWEPELYRVLGVLLDAAGRGAAARPAFERLTTAVPLEAGACQARALELARERGTRAFERRVLGG